MDLEDQRLGPLGPPLPNPHCRHQSQPTSYRLEFPTTFSVGLINFLEHLTELREIVYLLDHQFIIKGYNSETGRWKGRAGSVGKGSKLSYSPQISNLGSSPNPVILDVYAGFVT